MLQSEWIFYHASSELLALFTGSMAVILQKIHMSRTQNFSPFRFIMAAMSTRERVVCALTSNNKAVLKNIKVEMITKIRSIPTTDFGCMLEKGLLRRIFFAERAERSEAAELICHLMRKMYMKFHLLRESQNVPFWFSFSQHFITVN